VAQPSRQGEAVSRIIVVPDSARLQLEGCHILMAEEVRPEHVRDEHSANQLIERVAWALCDASDAEHPAASTVRARRQVSSPGPVR
jgi:hypothetical protein